MRNPLTICGIRLHLRIPLTNFADSTYILRHPLTFAESRTTSCICLSRNTTKFTLQIFVRGIHWNFVIGIHLHFGTYLKTCHWNPGTYRHKIVRLSSAQFGLVMPIEKDFKKSWTRFELDEGSSKNILSLINISNGFSSKFDIFGDFLELIHISFFVRLIFDCMKFMFEFVSKNIDYNLQSEIYLVSI